MLKHKEDIVLVWLKRDLRLQDNESIFRALETGKRVLFLYVFENILLEDKHYNKRHWDFVKESLQDLNIRLQPYQSKVLVVYSDIETAILKISDAYNICQIFSHQETGIQVTFDRDKAFAKFCKKRSIPWTETINNCVLRGLKNRLHWLEQWERYMNQALFSFAPQSEQLLPIAAIAKLEQHFSVVDLKTNRSQLFQQGGTFTGLKYASSFFQKRFKNYKIHISKPGLARRSCSRLSPYLAWGNLSIRQVYQEALKINNSQNSNALKAFISRLKWQAHFIQKFEMECRMEHESVNKGYLKLQKNVNLTWQKAWQDGMTGFPLVDACMRCLAATGYLNFRMRALVVSFFTHCLWQPWQHAADYLAHQFLDFEPGIHFPQIQMQAGETGINMLRIYNPVKNSKEHDPEAIFIKKWVPELAVLDTPFAHEPWLLTPLEEQLLGFKLGQDYPRPIIDLQKSRKQASDILWKMRKNPVVRAESSRILARHTLADRNSLLKDR